MDEGAELELDELEALARSANPAIDFQDLPCLREALRNAAGVRVPIPSREAELLGRLLFKIVSAARARLDVKKFVHLTDPRLLKGREETFVAVAGEYLRLVDRDRDSLMAIVDAMEEHFQKKVKPTIIKQLNQKGVRDLRAAIWLGSIVPRTGDRHLKDGLRALRKSFYQWLAHDEVVSELRAQLMATDGSPPPAVWSDEQKSTQLNDANMLGKVDSSRLYVHRHGLEVPVRLAVANRRGGVVFVGPSGVGKTTLANNLLRELSIGHPPQITYFEGIPEEHDLRLVMLTCGLLQPDEAREELSAKDDGWRHRLLFGQLGPDFIVLDNLDSTDELIEILPTPGEILGLPFPPRTRVIATCRKHGRIDLRPFMEVIEVPTMSLNETQSLIMRYLSVGSEESRAIALTLGGHPLTVTYACRLAIVRGVGLHELCHELSLNPELAPVPLRDVLTAILEAALEELRSQQAGAIDVLVIIIYAYLTRWRDLQVYFDIAYGFDSSHPTIHRAMQKLANLFMEPFVSIVDSMQGSASDAPLHPFTPLAGKPYLAAVASTQRSAYAAAASQLTRPESRPIWLPTAVSSVLESIMLNDLIRVAGDALSGLERLAVLGDEAEDLSDDLFDKIDIGKRLLLPMLDRLSGARIGKGPDEEIAALWDRYREFSRKAYTLWRHL